MSDVEHLLVVEADGVVRGLYTELVDLGEVGALEIERASHVEFNARSQTWEARWTDGQWIGAASTRRRVLELERSELQRALLG
ncbi:MAG: hypothetical protein ACK47B_27840 [Armatimonadota bacterium]